MIIVPLLWFILRPVRMTGSFRCWFVKKYCWLVCVREKYYSDWKFTIVYGQMNGRKNKSSRSTRRLHLSRDRPDLGGRRAARCAHFRARRQCRVCARAWPGPRPGGHRRPETTGGEAHGGAVVAGFWDMAQSVRASAALRAWEERRVRGGSRWGELDGPD